MKNVISAQTSHANNKETDLQEKVLHNVYVEIDGQVKLVCIMAKCPIDALYIVNEMTNEQCMELAQ